MEFIWPGSCPTALESVLMSVLLKSQEVASGVVSAVDSHHGFCFCRAVFQKSCCWAAEKGIAADLT